MSSPIGQHSEILFTSLLVWCCLAFLLRVFFREFWDIMRIEWRFRFRIEFLENPFSTLQLKSLVTIKRSNETIKAKAF